MKIQIEQIAIGVSKNSKNLVENIIKILGANNWVFDKVKFKGEVFGNKTDSTEALLNFNYDLIPGCEFEILEYTEGSNWHEKRKNGDGAFISHLGLHIDDINDFLEIKNKLTSAGIKIAQEANTFSHENKNVPENRRYHYLIMDTHSIFGFDLKLIHRTTVSKEGDKDGQSV